jgi:CRP-like cAMP-binding protein
MNIEDHIASISLFEGLTEGQRSALSRIALRRSYNKGRVIFSEGDEGSGFYVVISGRVKVFKLSSEGKEQILNIFGPGDPFGEVSVFSGKAFPACADAFEESSVLYFPREGFIRLIREDPSLSLNMLAVLSKRLRMLAALVDSLSLKEVPERLAAHLLYLSASNNGSSEINLDISKGQLAGLLGTIPETLSRIFTKMTREGLLKSEGSKIFILDRPGLEGIANKDRRLT